MTAPELCKVTVHFDPWVRILTDLENKNDNEKEKLSIVICTLAFYIFQSICKRERIKGKAYRNLSKLSTRMTSDRDSWPCFFSKICGTFIWPWEQTSLLSTGSICGTCGSCLLTWTRILVETAHKSWKRRVCDFIRSGLHWWRSTLTALLLLSRLEWTCFPLLV